MAVVGGAFLSSFLNVLFDRLSSPDVVNLIRGKKLDQKLIQRLETTLYVVQAVLNDAEQKQITDHAVKNWLASLQDAIYAADDLLDEVSTKAATRKGSCLWYWTMYFSNLLEQEAGKCDFNAYQVSRRGGVLNIHLDEQNHGVLLRGEAVTVMEGCLLV